MIYDLKPRKIRISRSALVTKQRLHFKPCIMRVGSHRRSVKSCDTYIYIFLDYLNYYENEMNILNLKWFI